MRFLGLVTQGGLISHFITIVAVTANAMQGDLETCLAAGMDDYLARPIRVQALAAALDGAVAR